MIKIKPKSELNSDEKKHINILILSSFTNSRLETYDDIVYYEENNEIIGFLGLQHYDTFSKVNQLCVQTDYRKSGIGTMLLKFIESNSQNTLILYIDKNKENTEKLYTFYTKRGYKETDGSTIEEYKMANSK